MMKQFQDHALVLSREADAGKEDAAQKFLLELLSDSSASVQRGFCIGRGSITLEPSRNEETRLVLSSADSEGVELKFATRTAGAPDLTTYSDIDEESQIAKAHGGSLAVLKNDTREVAGLSGKELWIRVRVPGEAPLMRYTWHFAGSGTSSEQPVIDLVGTVSGNDPAPLQRSYELVLGSLRAAGSSAP